MEPIVLTVNAPSVKYLRGGTKVGSPTSLDTSWGIMVQILNGRASVKDARPHYTHLQHWFIRGISKVGVPELLELRTELGQFGWLGAPLDSRTETTDAIVNQKETGEAKGCLTHL